MTETPKTDSREIEFLTPLDYRHVDGQEIVLLAPFVADVFGELILVPPGFHCDGASVPRFAWRVVGHPFGDYLESGVLHDWLYVTEWFPRSGCDEIFLLAMRAQGISWWRRNLMARAVKDWGWATWATHTPASITGNLALLDAYIMEGAGPDDWECPLGPEWREG